MTFNLTARESPSLAYHYVLFHHKNGIMANEILDGAKSHQLSVGLASQLSIRRKSIDVSSSMVQSKTEILPRVLINGFML